MEQSFQGIIGARLAGVTPAVKKAAAEEIGYQFFVAKLSIQIREARLAAGLSQVQLAETASLTQTEISRIEKGRYAPRLLTLFKLSTALKTDFSLATQDKPAARKVRLASRAAEPALQ